jgi:hypothetical protein
MRTSPINAFRAARLLSLAAGMAVPAIAMGQTVFYFENFESANINQLSGDPRVTTACSGNVPSFTHNPPAGWTWNGCGVPTFACRTATCGTSGSTCATCSNTAGVREWEGWSYVNKNFWVRVAGDQERSQFTKGVGNVAVADPDEWDDIGSPVSNCGYYNAFMKTPALNLSSITPGSMTFTFDSSWRYEGFDDGRTATNNQTAKIRAFYTVGGVEQAPIDVLHWDSDDGSNSGTGTPSPFFHDDNTNETVVLSGGDLQVPAGATSVRFEFGLTNAGNDWWWAIDNVVITADVGGVPSTLMAEDFERVTLEAPVNEIPSGCGVTYCGDFTYTHVGPNGVSVAVDSPASGGVADWRGWSFVRRPFWQCASGGPNGNAFTNSSGIVAVADGDEFDDLSHTPGKLDTTMSTPAIDVSGRVGNLLVLSFDSSWRWEGGQTAWVTAEYNDPAHTVTEVLRFESDPANPFFKADAVNENIAAGLEIPAGATSVRLKFRYEAGNNWWWAIDNISVFEGIAQIPVAAITPTQANMAVAGNTDYAPCFTPWSPTAPAGWTQEFLPVGSCPSECGRPEWRGWAFAAKSWWSTQVDTQGRGDFTKARGFVAIADPDEWDDFANGRSNFNAFMTTPSIAIAGSVASASLNFDSSWRYEGFDDSCSCNPDGVTNTNNQTAMIRAIYTVGGTDQAPVEVLHWDSDDGDNSGTGIPSAFLHQDNTNESVALDASKLHIPAGATAVRFEFSLTNARNDWWWALDNLKFTVNSNVVFSEDFDSLTTMLPPPSENPPVDECSYYSSVSAQGGNLTVDNTGLGNCSQGDFYGFNAWLSDAWARAGGGDRFGFGGPTAFVNDMSLSGCSGTARLVTPNYSIGSLNPYSLVLSFRSGWGSAAGHVSSVEISYNNGPWTSVLGWNGATRATVADEIVSIPLNNPFGASTVKVRFNDGVSGWWAVSDLAIKGTIGSNPCPVCAADFNNDGGVDGSDIEAFFTAWAAGDNCGDTNLDGGIDGSDIETFFTTWQSGGC